MPIIKNPLLDVQKGKTPDLWGYDWIPVVNPSLKATQNGVGFGKAILQEDKRRTGACFFSRSGAIRDIPCIRV